MNTHTFGPHSQQFIALVSASEMDQARELLKSQPSILTDRNVCEETPLHWLAIEDKSGGVKLLLEHGADPNTKSDYETLCSMTRPVSAIQRLLLY